MFDDEFNGMGGSYVVDPKTGKRKLIERTQETDKPEEPPVEPEKAKE